MSKDSADTGNPPRLGVGITYSEAIVPLLDRRPDLFHVVEIEPQTTSGRAVPREGGGD